MNEGKVFEADFKSSCSKQDIFILRIRDTYVPVKRITSDAFVPEQVADFVLHYNGNLFLMELKSTQESYITIERETSKGMIKRHQYDSLYSLTLNKKFEHGGLLLQFKRGKADMRTYYLPIEGFMRFLNDSDKKSINSLDVVTYGGINIDSTQLRVHYNYDIKKLFDEISKTD